MKKNDYKYDGLEVVAICKFSIYIEKCKTKTNAKRLVKYCKGSCEMDSFF